MTNSRKQSGRAHITSTKTQKVSSLGQWKIAMMEEIEAAAKLQAAGRTTAANLWTWSLTIALPVGFVLGYFGASFFGLS